METQDDAADDPVRVLVASGPFTPIENTLFLPFNDLLEVVRNDRPHVVILTGPFIDVEHSTFKDGMAVYNEMHMSFTDIFLFKGKYCICTERVNLYSDHCSSNCSIGQLTGRTRTLASDFGPVPERRAA